MKRKIAAVVMAAAAVAAPVSAPPAQAAKTHVCNVFAQPFDIPCRIALAVYCRVNPWDPICR